MFSARTRPLAAAVLTLGAAFGLTTVTGAPAAAHYSQCPAGEFCIWENSSYTGRFAHSRHPVPNVGSYMNDKMTSYWNRTDNWVSLYIVEDFQSCFESVPPGGSSAAVNPHYNDHLTSFRPGRFC
ncbi:peptidase inhibitor family I36 protein [Streptomyces sp. NPDC000594]|uniref:peptidase inhibitor family I36 protein n=1 Tax=Streptomyces sp. NPDC000594 TaxID=3154261 RepID=UPI003325B561